MDLGKIFGNAFGAGLVLVALPTLTLAFGVEHFSDHPTVGLALLAIFGIMILFGAMALTASLYATLNLSNRSEALGLPAGSVRAAIALSLVVLFATLAVMLFQSLARPDGLVQRLDGLSDDDKTLLLRQPGVRVVGVQRAACGAADVSAPGCFNLQLQPTPGSDAVDLAKQLLTLIGTLMTSVTSFYFASRAAEAGAKAHTSATTAAVMGAAAAMATAPGASAGQSAPPAATHVHPHEDDDEDGCTVDIAEPTRDEDLPAAKGGVA
jgi:hypothetical protein